MYKKETGRVARYHRQSSRGDVRWTHHIVVGVWQQGFFRRLRGITVRHYYSRAASKGADHRYRSRVVSVASVRFCMHMVYSLLQLVQVFIRLWLTIQCLSYFFFKTTYIQTQTYNIANRDRQTQVQRTTLTCIVLAVAQPSIDLYKTQDNFYF